MNEYLQAIRNRAHCAEGIARDIARGFQPHQSEVEQFRLLDAMCDALMDEFHAHVWPCPQPS